MGLGNYLNVGASSPRCRGIVRNINYDRACLEVLTKENVTFWSQYEACEDCKLLPTAQFEADGSLVLGTRSALRYAITNGNGLICNGTYQFGELGQYSLNVSAVTGGACAPRMEAEPDAASLPILAAVLVLLAMATLWYVVKGVGKRFVAGRWLASYFKREDGELGEEVARPTRCRSLDIFRGLCIALMVFVNAGGGGYTVFLHSAWNGLTVADLVFPWFAFAMGQALVLSLHARLRTALPRTAALAQLARRALAMSLVGVVLGSAGAAWGYVRLPGVLQRLAAMNLLVGSVECLAIDTTNNIRAGNSLIRDLSAGWVQWLVTLALVAVQVCVSLLVAAPGCPRGYSGPGGLHGSARGLRLENCTGGIAGHIDRVVFGPLYLSHYGTFNQLYHTTLPHDPEGLLGVLSGTLVVQAGAHASRVMLAYNHARARIMRWVGWSLVLGVSGGALCGFSATGGVIPLNENLWSVSYCLVTSALATAAQAALYYLVDLKNKWGGWPLHYAGQNALLLFVGSQLLENHFPFRIPLSAPTHAQLLAAHAVSMLLWLAIGFALYRCRVFVTL